MTVDWAAVSHALHTEIVEAIETAREEQSGVIPSHVEIIDLHLRDMLVLWPSMKVHFGTSTITPIVIEGSRRGDHWATQITALGGPGGARWDEVFATFKAVLDTAIAAAASTTETPICIGDRCGPAPKPPEDTPSIDGYVATDGPLSYDALTDTLARSPDLDKPLTKTLSVDSVRTIDATDVLTAVDALSSPYESIRRHAAIVLLSVHL